MLRPPRRVGCGIGRSMDAAYPRPNLGEPGLETLSGLQLTVCPKTYPEAMVTSRKVETSVMDSWLHSSLSPVASHIMATICFCAESQLFILDYGRNFVNH
jgi:hypothetical protein